MWVPSTTTTGLVHVLRDFEEIIHLQAVARETKITSLF